MTDARLLDEKRAGLEALRAETQARPCCALCPNRTNFVFGEGNPDAELMFVGEGPGQVEDETGRPFVGPAGQLLTKVLESVGITREEVYITNIVKCRPPNNRAPTDEEMNACVPTLERQIAVIEPKIIAMLGNTAKTFFLGKKAPGITRCIGCYYPWRDGIQLLALYHTSFLLRNQQRSVGSPKWQMWQAMKDLAARYRELQGGEPAAGAPEPVRQQRLF